MSYLTHRLFGVHSEQWQGRTMYHENFSEPSPGPFDWYVDKMRGQGRFDSPRYKPTRTIAAQGGPMGRNESLYRHRRKPSGPSVWNRLSAFISEMVVRIGRWYGLWREEDTYAEGEAG